MMMGVVQSRFELIVFVNSMLRLCSYLLLQSSVLCCSTHPPVSMMSFSASAPPPLLDDVTQCSSSALQRVTPMHHSNHLSTERGDSLPIVEDESLPSLDDEDESLPSLDDEGESLPSSSSSCSRSRSCSWKPA